MAKIAIIDDDVEFAEDVSVFLKKEGHDVSIKEDLDGAVQRLAADRPDLLILDVMFPGNQSGGFDMANEIRKSKELEDLPIILLTGVNQEYNLPSKFTGDDIDSKWMPVQEFVEKPVDMKSLLAKVGKLLEKSGE